MEKPIIPMITETRMKTFYDNASAILRIELEHIEPLIWRRVAVPIVIRLPILHRVIQVVMGWRDNHLWEFSLRDCRYSLPIPNDQDWNERITDASELQLSHLLSSGASEIGYLYDMGDNWQHRIIIEKIKPAELETLGPQFLGGERRCPPEDCGGLPGYHEFLREIASRHEEKRKSALAWYGGPYDPEDIGEQHIVESLNCFKARSG
jgi:Plasmid pRiA4b ORF-3-like protein